MSVATRKPESWYDSVVTALGGERAANELIAGRRVLVPAGLVDRPRWKSIRLRGSHPSQLEIDLGDAVQPSARPIFESMRPRISLEVVELQRYRVEELELSSRSGIRRILDRAKSCGLKLIPADAMPQLLAQVRLEAESCHSVMAGMEPVVCKDGMERSFELYENEDGKTLLSGVRVTAFEPHQEFLFALP